MSKSTVVGVFKTADEAEDAIRALDSAGVPIDRVSLVAKDVQSEKRVHGFVTSCDVAKAAAGTGAWLGGLFGLLVGAAFLWVPGVGPLVVAGSLTAALLGSVEGAVAGAAGAGLLSWLASLGISKEHILRYEEAVKAGKYLVSVQGSAAEVEKAQGVLQRHHAGELVTHPAVA